MIVKEFHNFVRELGDRRVVAASKLLVFSEVVQRDRLAR